MIPISISEKRKQYNKEYNARNKEQKYYNSSKASCKLFITTKGKKEDLLYMQELLTARLNDMKETN